MRIKPIRSESDYDEALHRVEALWAPLPGLRKEMNSMSLSP